MALGAKLKLGFIDGTCVQPAVTDVNYQRWIRCDYMVTCWVLNSMVTELSNAFLYTQSAQELWKEIAERYGQSNGPLIYRLEGIKPYSQGLPTCTCGKMRDCSCGILDKFLEMDSRSKLMQFLMKLSDEYEVFRRCNQKGHLVEQCFKRIGYPDWYKGKKGKKGARMAAQVTLDDHMAGDTPFDMGYENGIGVGKNGMFDQKLVAAVYSEVMKMFKAKGLIRDQGLDAHFYLNDFAFQDPSTNQIVAVGKGSKCLYICKLMLDPTTFFHNVSSLCQSHVNSTFPKSLNKLAYSNSVSKQHVYIHTFHSKLGHTSVSKLIHIHDCKHFNTMDFSCESCSLAKHHKLSFPKSTTVSSCAFELVHMDLWGPYKKPALNEAHYFFTIMDDYTRAT
ncbi:hypothetical protein Tco_0697518 [Tanacetum coccineum]